MNRKIHIFVHKEVDKHIHIYVHIQFFLFSFSLVHTTKKRGHLNGVLYGCMLTLWSDKIQLKHPSAGHNFVAGLYSSTGIVQC